MGSEASKPVQPPEDWEPEGARRSFEIISPVSDISNPSEMLGARHNRLHQQQRILQQQQQQQQLASKSKRSSKGSSADDDNGDPRRPKERQPLKALENNRRVSRTITTKLSLASMNKNKGGSSEGKEGTDVIGRTSSSSSTDLPAPSAFYFPTKDSKQMAERILPAAIVANKRRSSTGSKKSKFFGKQHPTEQNNGRDKNVINKTSDNDGKQDTLHAVNPAVSQSFCDLQPDQYSKSKRGIIKKTFKKTQKAMMACLDDSTNEGGRDDQREHKQRNIQDTSGPGDVPKLSLPKQSKHHPTLGVVVAKMSSSRNLTTAAAPMGVAVRKKSVENAQLGAVTQLHPTADVSELTTNDDVQQDMSQKDKTSGDHFESIALHHEEAYFQRLSLSDEGSIEASPFVRQATSNRVSSILERDDGINGLLESIQDDVKTEDAGRESVSTAVSDLFDASNSIPDRSTNVLALSPAIRENNNSPVSSLLRFYSATGPVESSPQFSYHSELEDCISKKDRSMIKNKNECAVNDDEQGEESEGISNQLVVVRNTRESSESHSSLYTNDGNVIEDKGSNTLVLQENNVSGGTSSDIVTYFHAEKDENSSRAVTILRSNSVVKGNNDPFRNKHGDKGNKDIVKRSKLESLFRPVLPTLSSDDAPSLTNYDQLEIKVTESAPGALSSVGSHIVLAPRITDQQSKKNMKQGGQLVANTGTRRSSIMSVDSQLDRSSSVVGGKLVSAQAEFNGEFLFSDDGEMIGINQKERASDNAIVSISTSGARSRLTQRSTMEKAVLIPTEKQARRASSFSSRPSYGSYKSERRVRFSTATIEDDEKRRQSKASIVGSNMLLPQTTTIPAIERTVSDLTDSVGDSHGRRSSGIVSSRSSLSSKSSDTVGTRVPSPVHSHSSMFRASKMSDETGTFGSEPEVDIKTKLSDLTEDASIITNDNHRQTTMSRYMPTPVREEENEEDSIDTEGRTDDADSVAVSSQGSAHWVVSNNGVTPYAKGRSTKKPTKSPLKRFKQAKQSFSMDARETTLVIKKSSSGGLVATRVEELNARVTEIRKIKRMRKKMMNPRLHTHKFDNSQPVRSRALINYKTQIATADVGKSNEFMAAKFNVIPDSPNDNTSELSSVASFPPIKQSYAHDENSDIESTNDHGAEEALKQQKYNNDNVEFEDEDEDETEDEFSKLSDGTTSVATVRQDKSGPRPRKYSESTASTSSGFSNIRRQGSRLFRESTESRSLASNGDSTTLSAVMQKENALSLPFRTAPYSVKPSQQNMHAPPATLYLSPTQRTPSQAMKWRSLAAAAQRKDAEAASKHPRRGLGLRSSSRQNVSTAQFQ